MFASLPRLSAFCSLVAHHITFVDQSLLGIKYVDTDTLDWMNIVNTYNDSHVLMFAPEPKLQSFGIGTTLVAGLALLTCLTLPACLPHFAFLSYLALPVSLALPCLPACLLTCPFTRHWPWYRLGRGLLRPNLPAHAPCFCHVRPPRLV